MNLLRKENMFSLVSLSKSILLTRVAIILFVAFVLHWCRSCCTYAALVLLVLHCCFQRLIITKSEKVHIFEFQISKFFKIFKFQKFHTLFSNETFLVTEN